MTEIAILIGGPAAGQRYSVKNNEPYLRVAEKLPMPVVTNFTGDIPESYTEVKYSTYTPRMVHFQDQKIIKVFVWDKLSDYEAYIEILNHYIPDSAYDYR